MIDQETVWMRHNSPTEGGLLQLLASVQRVTKLEQSDVVLCDAVDEVASGVELTKSQLVVVLVIKNVEKGGQERVEVLSEVDTRVSGEEGHLAEGWRNLRPKSGTL